MPGYNREQDQLISSVLLRPEVKAFAENAAFLIAKQNELLAANLLAAKKKPSIFKAGLWNDAIYTYTLAGSQNGNAYKYWIDNGITTAKVFDIGDADIVNVRIWNVQTQANFAPFQFGFVLSPNDATNPVSLDQSSFLGTGQNLFLNTSPGPGDGWQYVFEAIPTAGNRFLHLFGGSPGSDMWSVMTNPPSGNAPIRSSGMSYALIK